MSRRTDHSLKARDVPPDDRTHRQSDEAEGTSSLQPHAGTGNASTTLAVCGLLLLAVFVVFGQTVNHDFVNYDDNDYVYENQHVRRGLISDETAWAITAQTAGNWHPLTWLSHMFDCQVYDLQPGGHHLTNLLLHAAAAALLFLVLQRMTGELWPSAWVAAVFAIHPLRVESVAWVAERKDVLSGLFFMLTLWFYARYAQRPASWTRYLLVLASFALGLTAKPMLVTLPLLLLLLDYWPLARFGRQRWVGEWTSSPPSTVHLFPALSSRENPLVRPGRGFVRDNARRERNAMPSWTIGPPASRQCRGGLRGLPRENVLPDRAGCLLSSSPGSAAGLGGHCCGDPAGGDFHNGLPGQAEVSVPALRVALVSWNPGAGDRIGAGGQSGHGRPLHVPDADRAVRGVHLGHIARGRRWALSAPGPRGRRDAGGGSLDGLCLAADGVLA